MKRIALVLSVLFMSAVSLFGESQEQRDVRNALVCKHITNLQLLGHSLGEVYKGKLLRVKNGLKEYTVNAQNGKGFVALYCDDKDRIVRMDLHVNDSDHIRPSKAGLEEVANIVLVKNIPGVMLADFSCFRNTWDFLCYHAVYNDCKLYVSHMYVDYTNSMTYVIEVNRVPVKR